MPADIYLNVAISGLLTGLVYGLMALGLSVIFGVVRVVNFAHGEMMTIAMYLAVVLFAQPRSRPAADDAADCRRACSSSATSMQLVVINPFIARPEHSQFMLMVAVAIIIVNALLMIFGPDAQTVQTSYAFDSFAFGPLIVDATKLYAGLAAILVAARAVCVLSVRADRQGDPRLRRQLHRRAGGRPRRQAALRAVVRPRARPASGPPAPSSC